MGESLGMEKLKTEFRRASPPIFGVWSEEKVGIGLVVLRSGCTGRANDDVWTRSGVVDGEYDVGFWHVSTSVGEEEVDIEDAAETSLTADTADLIVAVVAEDPDDDIDPIVGLLTPVEDAAVGVGVLPKNIDSLLVDDVEGLVRPSVRLSVDENADG